VKEFAYNGFKFYFLSPEFFFSGSNISAQIFSIIKNSLLPPSVELIVTEPAEGIVALIYISIFLGILFCMPLIVYEINSFVSPGLYVHEKKLIAKLILPSTFLFIGGCIFAYFSIIPFSLNFLYQYAGVLGAREFITIDSFTSFVMLFMLGFGVAFQLPVIMVALSSMGVIPAKFWMENMKYAFAALVVFGAVITPDGSGITMWLVALPMFALYLAGYVVAGRYKINLTATPQETRVLPSSVKGLILSLLFGAAILGYSIFAYEFNTAPVEALAVGLLLIAVYIVSIHRSWKEDMRGFIAAIAGGSLGLILALLDPPVATFFFKTGVSAPLLIGDLLFILTQILTLYFGFRALEGKMLSRKLSDSLLTIGGDLYE